MPSTRARSDGLRNGPALSRKATIRAALRFPIPEIRSRSATDPRLITSVVTRSADAVAGPGGTGPGGATAGLGGEEKARFGAMRASLEGPIPGTREARRYPRRVPNGSVPRRCDARDPTQLRAGAGVPGPRLDPHRFAHRGPGAGQGAPDCRVVRARRMNSRSPAAGRRRAVGGHRTRPCAPRDHRVRGQGGAVPRDVQGSSCECRVPLLEGGTQIAGVATFFRRPRDGSPPSSRPRLPAGSVRSACRACRRCCARGCCCCRR